MATNRKAQVTWEGDLMSGKGRIDTVSSGAGFVEKHPDIVERFLKGMIEGIHFFKTRPTESIRIIQERCTKHGQMNLEQATITHQSLAGIVNNDRHVLARQPRAGFECDPFRRHVGRKQRMA